MASSVTLAQLRLDARLYADQRPGSASSFITETELTRLVNGKVKELYDLLLEARGCEYYATEATIAIAAGTPRYDLPANFYQLSSVTLEWTDLDFELLFPVTANRQRTPYQTWRLWSRYEPKAFRLRASQLEFLPTPTGDVTCRIQYAPTFTELSADGDTFDFINGWEKMVTLGVAIEMRAIEKRTANDLMGMYQEQRDRIETLKTERDQETPKEVIDVTTMRRGRAWYGNPWDNGFNPGFGPS